MTSLLDALHKSEQERSELANEWLERELAEPLLTAIPPGLGEEAPSASVKPAKQPVILAAVFGLFMGAGVVGLAWWQLPGQSKELIVDEEVLTNSASKQELVRPISPLSKLVIKPQQKSEELALVKATEAKLELSKTNATTEVEIQTAPIFYTRPLVVLDRDPSLDSNTALPKVIESKPVLIEAKELTAAKEPELDFSQISPKLAQAFQRAVNETSTQTVNRQPKITNAAEQSAIPIDELPQSLRSSIPNISYDSHVYSSSSERRRIKINGIELAEGDKISPSLQLLEIKPNSVILRHKGQSFSLEALTDWPY